MRELPVRLLSSFALLCLVSGAAWSADNPKQQATPKAGLHDVAPESCKQCHEEIYQQWKGSMHANASALKDPIHAAFYNKVAGDPRAEGVVLKANKKYPVCLKCHAPVAAMEKKTKLDTKQASSDGVGCVSCHSFTRFKGSTSKEGKPQLGIDAYEIDTTSLHGPKGNTYTTERVPEGSKWPTPINHTVPLQGNKAALFKSNDICMGCHDKRSNAHGTPLCSTGKEYRDSKNTVACQSCHMANVTVAKLKDGVVVPGETVTIADHSTAGGHDDKMVSRGLALSLDTEKAGDSIKAKITLKNRLPHSFPTGAPFRNFFVKIAAYDKDGKELWKNFKVHPIKDDPKAAFWLTLGDAENKPTMPPKATQILADTRMKPNETRTLEYDIPNQPGTAIIRAEALYDLLLPPLKKGFKDKVPAELMKPKLAASAEVRF